MALCCRASPQSRACPVLPAPPQVLATKVRNTLNTARGGKRGVVASDGFNYSTTRLMNKYLQTQGDAGDKDVFPASLLPKAK